MQFVESYLGWDIYWDAKEDITGGTPCWICKYGAYLLTFNSSYSLNEIKEILKIQYLTTYDFDYERGE